METETKKKKIIIIALIIIGAILVAGSGFYFLGKDKPVEEKIPENNDQQSQSKIVTDDFDVVLPAGWEKIQPMMGTLAMANKADEKLNDPPAEKINFKTYFAISYDTSEVENLSEYMEMAKQQVLQNIPNAIFLNERDMTINERPAHVVESELSQQGVDFKVLMVIIAGEGDDIWGISFNTVESKWEEYEGEFFDIVESFNLKK